MSEFKYVSAVAGHSVARYGTGGRYRNNVTIGAKEDGTIDPNAIVKIPAAEWGRFAKEYFRALKDGALKERDEKEYEAWISAEEKRVQAEFEAKTREFKEAEAAAKKAAEVPAAAAAAEEFPDE